MVKNEKNRKRGFFFVLEGPDGSGKTTQIARLGERLKADGYDVITTRQPGGSSFGEPMRELLLLSRKITLSSRSELGLFLADHAQFVEEVVRPAMKAGQVLLCDRYIGSTIAYQGAGRGLGEEAVRLQAEWMVDGVFPDLIGYLLPTETSLRNRRQERGTSDKLEEAGEAFRERVYRSYHRQAARPASGSGKRFVLPGDLTIEETTNALYRAIIREMEDHDR